MAQNQATDVIAKRREKIQALKDAGVELFPNDFAVTHTVAGILKSVADKDEDMTGAKTVVRAAGRMMAVNRFGKSAFIRFRDRTGQMQAYIRQDRVGGDAYAFFKKMDIGDFIGLQGTLFVTKTGEWTLLAEQFELLAKSYRPLPEKFHGLKDPEKRYRQRYLDLIMNPEVRDVFVKRSRLIREIRDFLTQREFLEVETPMMQPIAGGADARPFKTHHNALDMDLYLRIAPELYLKRLVVGGFERVFEINRNFRNEGVSTQHNPEFTMLEFYQAHATYEDLMVFTEQMFETAARAVTGATKVLCQGREIEFGGPYQRLDLLDALTSVGGVDPALLSDKAGLMAFAKDNEISLDRGPGDDISMGKLITKVFDHLVEPNLIQPTYITGYPVEVSPLSRRSARNPEITERFELFIAGREIANGFSELNDPVDQKARFVSQVESRELEDHEARVDEDYILALEYGMPPTAGEGVGIDRLAMLLTDSASIRDVILFPHLKFADTR
ncbi:lysyl-tRNA synthetase class 2 [Desulfosalsimonas propionicica]|uniref:Lysine--tRNA ligase n=1 Tax=Desulfosalsimonas propionicica TaxID=332175 RepID=A0A7W0HM01_9BACT|nr:lysine--tRNA ligase [Desulfosalsimonas propionicica]MBA2882828.1 lysyl-tRNA synthetase class 2 [Desulfosalsimonas propionicica]